MFLNFVVKQSTIDLETICGLRLGIILLIERIFLGVALIVRRRAAVLVEEGRNAEEARRESGEGFRLAAQAGKCSRTSGMLPLT